MNIYGQYQWEKAFFEACEEGSFENVRHLCQRKYLIKKWASLHAHKEKGLIEACAYGHLEVVQYLLTSNELKEAGHTFANLHVDNEVGFRRACDNGHLEVVQYLLTSPELIEAGHAFADVHAQQDQGFHWACQNEQWEVVRWLIMDYGIEKTRDIEKIMEQYPQVQEYFRVREERQAIQGVFDDPVLISSFSERTDEKVIKKAKKL